MGWASDVLMITECGGRAWAHWGEEDWHRRRGLNADGIWKGPYRSEFTGRFCHPMTAQLLRRILKPEWTWDPKKLDERDLETHESVVATFRFAGIVDEEPILVG